MRALCGSLSEISTQDRTFDLFFSLLSARLFSGLRCSSVGELTNFPQVTYVPNGVGFKR